MKSVYDSCSSIRGEESFYFYFLSVVLALAAVLALSVIIKTIFIASSTVLNLKPKGNVTNQVNLAVTKVSTDQVAIILSYLPRSEIMRARVCKAWRDAAKKTIVPLDVLVLQMKDLFRFGMDFDIDYGFGIYGSTSYHAATVMTSALPGLQQLTIGQLGNWQSFLVGEDPYELRADETKNDTMHDVNLVSIFSKLRILRINSSDLNGRYPTLFNFPLLRKLRITSNCRYLKWDLEMLAGCPLLEELDCRSDRDSPQPSGNISSLKVLKNTLHTVKVSNCIDICGNLMDLSDFPRLREMDLESTAVTGDIRHIGEDDFPSLETFLLPSSVIGGMGYEFQSVSDVPAFMDTIHPFLNRALQRLHQNHLPPSLGLWTCQFEMAFGWELSSDSPDWYWPDEGSGNPLPPFLLRFIRAGTRLGWSWRSKFNQCHCCQICWLDPEPNRDSDDYEVYIRDLNRIHKCADYHTYAEYQQPPTEEEYQRLFEE